MAKDGINLETVIKANELVSKFTDLTQQQARILRDIVTVLEDYSNWLLEQLKENR